MNKTKHILLLGVALVLGVLALAPKSAEAALYYCSDLDDGNPPLMSITIGGTTCANSDTQPDKICSISVVSGTTLTASYWNETAIPNAPYSLIGHAWPNNQTTSYTTGGTRSHTTNPITSDLQSFSMGADRDCDEYNPDGTFYGPEHGGSVYIGLTVVPPLSVAVCSGTPNPAETGQQVTWSVPTPTGGTGSYSYSWTGSNGLSGTTRTVNKTYSVADGTGTKNAQVVVTSGTQTITKNCSITVNAPTAFNFTVADEGNKSVVQGGSVTNAITVTKTAGTAASVALTASGLPSGATASYSPTSCTPNTTCSSTLTINSGTAAAGTYTITVTGTSGATVRTDTFQLTITTAPPVTCTGPTTGVPNTAYTFTASGGTTYTWAISPTTGLIPTGATGSGSQVLKAFSTTGSRTITFTSGGQSGTCTINISSTPAFDFTVSDGGIDVIMTQNTTGNGTITVTKTSGTAASVAISASGVPAGATISFSPTSCTPNTSCTSAMTINSGSATPGTYTITVSGTSGATTRTDTFQLVIVLGSPSCSATSPTVVVGDYATFNASGGDGNYGWTGGELPPTGNGSSFTTQYTTTGTKTVTVQNLGTTLTGQCSVEVVPVPASVCQVNVACGQIRVTSNLATTWDITGPQNFTQGAPGATTATYNVTSCDASYSIVNVPDIGGVTPVITPLGGAGWLQSGQILDFNINYGEAAPDVDLKANNSDGPVEVAEGTKAYLTWETSDQIADGTCFGSTDPTTSSWDGGPKSDIDQFEWSPAIEETLIFTLTCENEKGVSFNDFVTVGPRPPECSDEKNNDDDKFTDCDDPGCYPNGGFPDPSSCVPSDDSEEDTAQCRDGQDNDKDGFIDHSSLNSTNPDIGCSSADDNSETNAAVTECNDGLDNDADGGIDHVSVTPDGKTEDIDCESPLDPSELKDPDIREI